MTAVQRHHFLGAEFFGLLLISGGIEFIRRDMRQKVIDPFETVMISVIVGHLPCDSTSYMAW
jgi:hypothetical protein